MHHRHMVELGAQMMLAGLWHRPAFYDARADRELAIREEVLAVRSNVGLIDVSTLGGLDIRGPDAAEFLNRALYFGIREAAPVRPIALCPDVRPDRRHHRRRRRPAGSTRSTSTSPRRPAAWIASIA